MKRFLILLILVAGGLAAAAFSVPSNAAVVNGVVISQQQLDSDVSAIANSQGGLYGCYLNAEQEVISSGKVGLPPINGAGTPSGGGARTTTAAFAANYLDTEINHQLLVQLAARHHVTVGAEDLSTARSALESQIESVLQEVSSDQQLACGNGLTTLSGKTVLDSMPSAFVDQEVRFDATVDVLEEALSGVGSAPTELEGYYQAHRSEFDAGCLTLAEYSTSAAAQAAVAQVKGGTSFATLAAATSGGGPQGCEPLAVYDSELPPGANLQDLAVNTVSAPLAFTEQSGTSGFLLMELTSRTPTPYAQAKTEVQLTVQNLGANAAQTAIINAEKTAAVSIDPRYGKWDGGQVLPPLEPPTQDLLNGAVNSPATATAAAAPATPSSGQSG